MLAYKHSNCYGLYFLNMINKMITLKDLKLKLEEIESELPDTLSLNDIPLQQTIYTDINFVEIELHNYLGFNYAIIKIE